MPKRPNTDRPRTLNTTLPESLLGRLELFLFSEIEGRVPHGAYAGFLTERIREFFSNRPLDLAAWTGAAPGAYVVSGTPETIEALTVLLNRKPQ